jgi:F420-non-reducing hydrogenase iron-sulfur subunit
MTEERAAVAGSSSILAETGQSAASAGAAKAITAFLCANCSRPGLAPDSGGRPRPAAPCFDWPFPVSEILVACTGRLQPEHVLKAFESGADLVLTVSCEEDNCQYLQGSTRWARRVGYVRSLLDEIGLGGERLLHFSLAGTATQDTALGAGRPASACTSDVADTRIAAIRASVLQALAGLTANPLGALLVGESDEEIYQQVDTSDEANED